MWLSESLCSQSDQTFSVLWVSCFCILIREDSSKLWDFFFLLNSSDIVVHVWIIYRSSPNCSWTFVTSLLQEEVHCDGCEALTRITSGSFLPTDPHVFFSFSPAEEITRLSILVAPAMWFLPRQKCVFCCIAKSCCSGFTSLCAATCLLSSERQTEFVFWVCLESTKCFEQQNFSVKESIWIYLLCCKVT